MFSRAPKPSVAKSTSALRKVNVSAALRSQRKGQMASVRGSAIIAGTARIAVSTAVTNRMMDAGLAPASRKVMSWSS